MTRTSGTKRVGVAEGNLEEAGRHGAELAAEDVLPGSEGEAGVAVVALAHGDDLGTAGVAPRQFDRYVNRLRAAGGEGGVLDVARGEFGQTFGQHGPHLAHQHVVADVQFVQRPLDGLDDAGRAVAQVEDAAGGAAVEQ